MVVIVTRPANAGQRLFDRVAERGHQAVWWPAFDIGTAPDAEAARVALSRLSHYQLAIFVSASAVSATRALLNTEWPTRTVIGAVGESTRVAIETELQPVADATVIAPGDGGESGSEAFWRAWQAGAHRARRVLLLRAEEGRNWLADRFRETGAEVDAIAVYARRPRNLSAEERSELQRLIADRKLAVAVFSSTEAVAALDAQVGAAGQDWLRAGTAIACHPRIADRLTSNGYSRVLDTTFDDDSIIAKLESICTERSKNRREV
ncbi:MAG: uroporphyrinogen-III synthase [Burkholderiaceae bacterium]